MLACVGVLCQLERASAGLLPVQRRGGRTEQYAAFENALGLALEALRVPVPRLPSNWWYALVAAKRTDGARAFVPADADH